MQRTYARWLRDLRMADLPEVGGKNASLGEMLGGLAQAGIRVPDGFATTAQAYQEFLFGNPMLAIFGIMLAWQVFDVLFGPIFLGAVNVLYPGVSYS